jgi:hypothetical protein
MRIRTSMSEKKQCQHMPKRRRQRENGSELYTRKVSAVLGSLFPDRSFAQNNVTYTVVMNDGLRSIWKEIIVVYFKALLQHL